MFFFITSDIIDYIIVYYITIIIYYIIDYCIKNTADLIKILFSAADSTL